jgi:hypothetical protein
MKKYIFTESQIKKIIDNQITENKHLQEQTFHDDQMQAINAGTKAFLDAKKIQGKDLTDRIKQYQLTIDMDGLPDTNANSSLNKKSHLFQRFKFPLIDK